MTPATAYNAEAEKTVLGGVLVHPKALFDCATLDVQHFYPPHHQAIWAAIRACDLDEIPIDDITVSDAMKHAGTFDTLRGVGGLGYFTELKMSVVTIENIAYHVKRVQRDAKRRRFERVFTRLAVEARDEGIDGDDFLDVAERAILDLTDSPIQGAGPRSIAVVAREVMHDIEQRAANRSEGGISGAPSGLTKLDLTTLGWQPEDLIIVGARPSMGKTAFVLGSMLASAKAGFPCLDFSLEMRDKAQVERVISGEAIVDGYRMRTGRLERNDWIALQRASSEISVLPITVDDCYGPTLNEIRTKARIWRARLPKKYESVMGVIVIDYLQLIEGMDERNDNRANVVAKVSRGLKHLARETKCALVALSQLNRKLEERQDKRPMMSDLRESGALEQDADVIAFLYRDEVYSKAECKEEDKGVAEIIVGKQRNGPTRTVRVGWDESTMRFYNLREDDAKAAPAKKSTYHPHAPAGWHEREDD